MAASAPGKQQTEVLLSCPELGIPTRSLTIDPDVPFLYLKLSLLRTLSLPLAPSSLHLSSSGKPLPDSSTPSSARLPRLPIPILLLRPRLPGGGGDGGATGAESRDCYLHMYSSKKPDKVDPNETRLCRWSTCALSFEPLQPPCVLDRLGNVFNKEALLTGILHKTLPNEFRHIRGLRDMIPLDLAEIPGAAAAGKETRFQCPVAALEFNGKYPFFALRGCGHVVSAKALKEVRSSECLVCHKEFSEGDKIPINGSKEEVVALRERMEQEMVRMEKKKKKKRNGEEGKNGVAAVGNCGGEGVAMTKRFRAVDMVPANANKEVYASIFTSSKKVEAKETFTCRSLPLGRN